MDAYLKAIVEQIEKLSEADRLALLRHLIEPYLKQPPLSPIWRDVPARTAGEYLKGDEAAHQGKDAPKPDIDRVWADEGERRLDAYLRGDAKSRDPKGVLAKHLKP